MALGAIAVLGIAAIVAAAVQWPVLAWSTVHGHPTLIEPAALIATMIDLVLPGELERAGSLEPAGGLPPAGVWIALDAVLALVLAGCGLLVWVRVDRCRATPHLGLAGWDPRRRLLPRAWARPRDWSHLHTDPADACAGGLVQAASIAVRVGLGERRRPARRGGDGWSLGRLRGRDVRSAPEQHLVVVAPTRSGKTRRVVANEAVEHDGPAVILSNKLDVYAISRAARRRRGPVWIYAPLTPEAGRCVGWTPLMGCQRWEHALLMAQWLFDADPTAATASQTSGGARFYNQEAVAALVPALLQAAALSASTMADVLAWLRGGTDALDIPREHARDHDANRAAHALAGVQALDERPRSLLLMSAAQLISAYRHPNVQAADRHQLDPAELVHRNGTLYLVAPESQADLLAPIFGAILGAVLRECEHAAARVHDPRTLPLLKILADEAAHLAPLGKLPTYLSVSAGWGVRWCLVYQSLAQIRYRYGAQADAVLANTLCKLFLGPIHDRTTRDEIVALLGYTHVAQPAARSRALAAPRARRHRERRPTVSAEELARIRDGQAIAVHGRDLPAVVDLPFYDQRRPR